MFSSLLTHAAQWRKGRANTRSPLERVWSLCWVLMEWNNDIQQTGFQACVADMKCRVNIPSGLCKPLPSASPIASVNHNPPGTGLVLHSLIDFYCGVYFILCRKETVCACRTRERVWWRGDPDSPLLLVEEEMDIWQEGMVTEQGRMDSEWQ